MSLMPWSPLAGGFLSGKFTRSNIQTGDDSRRNNFDFPPINKEKAFDIIEVMQKIAVEKGISVAQIALAWLLKKSSVSSIIIGAKRKEQLLDNLGSINVELTIQEMQTLDEVSATIKPYPIWMVERQSVDRIIK